MPTTMLEVQSPAFAEGSKIPERYTGEGDDVSPPLRWPHLPPGTAELALIVDDPDAPTPQPWVHWVIYKIPADAEGLPEGIPAGEFVDSPTGALQGRNTWGSLQYRGPLPPKGHGPHRYHFTLYALDAALELRAGLDKDALLRAISGHVLATGILIGTYER